ncbi:NACHT domain-containing protein [Sphingobacterium puteale]|uniref:NACHT domain-containing protein n=1 Tax=Sphingobacterium puteale TaxID=2420510 RepID=A0A420VTX0_9SPHI|nr:NACHT domain-containing protein [Sphingobacterium puteale]RKO69754.1 NACHT domain-containing protein [Sphingobacterium puteale]
MGKFLEQFKGMVYSNEAEVSQNFIIPLLTQYLGYSITEIIPEKNFPAQDIFSGVRFSERGSKGLIHRPDFIICIDGDLSKSRFIIDSKGPGQSLEDHIGQLKSYATSVGKNFLMITNGKVLLVYDVNTLIFRAEGIEELQLKLDVLNDLLGRKNQLFKSQIEILREFNFNEAVSQNLVEKFGNEKLRKELQISDFKNYLKVVKEKFENWHLPNDRFKAINNIELKKIDPNYLLLFKLHSINEPIKNEENKLKFVQIETTYNINKKVFVGETGAGKTSFLKFLHHRTAENALEGIDVKIPIFIALKEIGNGYTLENLISSALIRYGYKGKDFEERNSITQFVFFLDAFDEIEESFKQEVCNAIENLSSQYECFITTRPNNLPMLNSAVIFDICPLNDTQVEKVARHYLGSGYYRFQNQIEKNDLTQESRNTLLLLFMISLYKEKNYLPDSVAKIVNELVERVKLWQDSRNMRPSRLKWEQVSRILAELGYWIMKHNAVSIKLFDAEPIIIEMLNEFEQTRKIKPGVTVNEVVDELTTTGLIIVGEDHLFFWHRLFLNHFSALSLQNNLNQIEELSSDEKWDIAIITLATRVNDVTIIIKSLKNRLWLSAYCLTENSNCNKEIKDIVVSRLIEQVGSPVPNNRSNAISFLEKINDERVQNFFMDCFESTQHKDVKMMCLSAMALNTSMRAKDIIFSQVDWDESSFFHGRSSQAYIVQALSHFGDQGYIQIISNWEKYSNYPLEETCKRIFQRLQRNNNLNQGLVDRLQNLFFKELRKNSAYGAKLEAIADILSKVPNLKFAEEVLDKFLNQEDSVSSYRSVFKILKNSPNIQLVEKIKDALFNENLDSYKCELLSKILKHSNAVIPKEIFHELINHKNTNVASYCLHALNRFPYQDVEKEVERHLYGEQAQLQSWALKILVDNGKIINLIRENRFPNHFYTPTAHILLEAVRRFHLIEAIPILQTIQDELSYGKMYLGEYILAYELAGTFNYIGEKERQRQIIAKYFDGSMFLYKKDKYLQTNLMKKLKYFDKELAVLIAKAFYNEYLPPSKNFSYETEVFIETAEDIGGEWMREKIKTITEHYLNQIKVDNKYASHLIERPLRALTKIGRADDEDWLLEKLPYFEFDAGAEYNQLRRAIECFASIGSKKTLPVLIKMSEKYQMVDSVMNILQFSYNNICSREKIPMEDIQQFSPSKN